MDNSVPSCCCLSIVYAVYFLCGIFEKLEEVGMLWKPIPLGGAELPEQEMTEDKKACRKFGPCGVGKKALYLNSFYIDRRYYVPVASVSRVFKRVAMSKGGFTGKGMFASIPYLVVEYDDGRQKQCNFKYEKNVDLMLACIAKEHPQIQLVSKEAQERIRRREEEEKKRVRPVLTKQAEHTIRQLERARDYLLDRKELSIELSASAKAKRIFDNTHPAYKWTAFFIVLMGVCSLLYGIVSLMMRAGNSTYFLLFGLAAIFLFSGANVIPTAKNNRRAVYGRYEAAKADMETYLKHFKGHFPLPPCYAHPVTLERMIRVVKDGAAQDALEALGQMMKELRRLNADVEVDQEEYDEIVAVKPMFLAEKWSFSGDEA